MTKEELKKEAIQYAVDYPTSYGKGYKHKDLRVAYLAGAEPREKRISELEAQIENLEGIKLAQATALDTEYMINESLKEDLKSKDLALEDFTKWSDNQLTKAKEIIATLLNTFAYPISREDWTVEDIEVVNKAEQFLKELEE